MEKRRSIFEHVMEQTVLYSESVPGQPIVEISGDRRVLIENHKGVAAYGQERILINVKFGMVCVCGCNLEIVHMTKEQLVIWGRIDSVGLQRRK